MSSLVAQGVGPPLLMIHGSAADHSTWTVQLASLRDDFAMLAYDRDAREGRTVENHADDAAEILRSEVQGPAAVVGSSFGAIVALDLARRCPDLVSSLFLCEPPLAQSDALAPVPDGFACRFDSIVACESGEAAAEFFLRNVLGDESFERMPKTYRRRSMAAWRQIRADMTALARYRVRYSELRDELRCATVLLGGSQSAAFYRDTLEALQWAIPGAELIELRGAGHMMHVDAHRQFGDVLRRVGNRAFKKTRDS
jgi:pimeloyl-ACP methyl ester carboxylesterase